MNLQFQVEFVSVVFILYSRTSFCCKCNLEVKTESGHIQGRNFIINSCPSSGIKYAPVVTTGSGDVRGKSITFNGVVVNRYSSIPYAKPPVGNLRFRNPEPVEKWTGVQDAVQMPPACPQIPPNKIPALDFCPGQNEDCLYLNVWSPSTPSKNKAVMFFIHGGFFQFGSSRLREYDGLALAAIHDVIIVTINYRVGPLALFYTGTEDAPGNLGLHDCVEALKWVNKNIDTFGGDPKSITLFGQSAGAISISIMSVVPSVRDLYKRAIIQSGSVDIVLLYDDGPNDLVLSQLTAEALKCANATYTVRNHPKEVAECLRNKPAFEVIKKANKVLPIPYFPVSLLLPHSNDSLVPRDPREALSAGDFHRNDLLIGVNRDEGAYIEVVILPEVFGVYGNKTNDFEMDYGKEILEKLLPKLGKLFHPYFDSENIKGFPDPRYITYTAIGDFLLTCPTAYYAQEYAERENNVYFYFFAHRPSSTIWAPWMGATHFEEVQFVFGLPLLYPDEYQDTERELSKRMMKIWTHFAKHGNPGPDEKKWPLYSSRGKRFMRILNTSQELIDEEGPHCPQCDALKLLYLASDVAKDIKDATGIDPKKAAVDLLLKPTLLV